MRVGVFSEHIAYDSSVRLLLAKVMMISGVLHVLGQDAHVSNREE